MRIFLTGATGVIGRRLVPLLREAGHHVTAVARWRGAHAQLERHGATAVAVDLFEPGAVRRAVAGHDAVVNLATHIPDPSRMFLPWAWRENDRLRREASAVLSDACVASDVTRFIQESFAPVYPDCGDQWIDESTPIKPVRYNRSILDAESSARRFGFSGRTAVVLRFGAFYGPDALQTTQFIKYVSKGWAPLPGPATAYVSSVSHDDAAAAVAAAITLPAGTYNVVDNEPVTHKVYAESLAEALQVAPPKLLPPWVTPLFGSLGALAARSVRISNRRFRSASDWTPRYSSVRQGWGVLLAQVRGELAWGT
jgi:2-alkyl-3-oxoalkanoate reductase